MDLVAREMMKMPKLQSVRVINAQFNEGKGIYQDFRMPFYGRNATYELGNGMGKSVLLMLILQCVLPNASLDSSKPFRDMFAGGDRNRTTHVLAEWELDEVVDGKKYLLTGFCAKRKSDQEDEGESGEIEYFSYLHLYSGPNDLDIVKIPLCREEGTDFFTLDFSETKKMLREKAKAGYDIWIADTRQRYLERLKSYYLIESEWELIKLINRQESYLKTHFHSFRSSRAFVEDLLIKMINRCLLDRRRLKFHDGDDDPGEKAIAAALYQSQEKLRQLQEEQARLHEYERLQSEITSLLDANDHLLRSYNAYEETKQRSASQYVAYIAAIARKEGEGRHLQEQIDKKQAACEDVRLEAEKIKLKIQNVHLNLSRLRLERAEVEKLEHERAVATLRHQANFARAVNKYLSIEERGAGIREREEIMRTMEEEHQVIFARIRPLGKTLHTIVAAEMDRINEVFLQGQNRAKKIYDEIMRLQQNLGGIKGRGEETEKRIAQLEQESTDLEARERDLLRQHERCPKVSAWFSRLDQIKTTTEQIVIEREHYSRFDEEIREIEQRISANEALEPELKAGIMGLDRAIGDLRKEIDSFMNERGPALQIADAYGMDDIKVCAGHLRDRAERLRDELAGCRNRRDDFIRELESAEKYGVALNREFLDAFEKLREKYPAAISGAEHLKVISEDERRVCLINAPWLMKAVLLLRGDFEAIVRNPATLPAPVQDAAIVITSIDHLRERRPLSLGDVYITSRVPEQSLTALDSDRAAEHLRREIKAVNEEIKRSEEALEAITRDLGIIHRFIGRYPPEFEQEKEAVLGEYLRRKSENVARFDAIQSQLREDRSALPRARTDQMEQKKTIVLFERKLDLLNALTRITEEREKIHNNLQQERRNDEEIAALQRQTETAIGQRDSEYRRQKENNDQMRESLRKMEQEISDYEPYANEDVAILPDTDIDHLRSEYRGARKVVEKDVRSRENYERENARDRKQIENDQNDIASYRISLEEIRAEDPQEYYSSEYIQEVNRDIEGAERFLEEAADRYVQIVSAHHLLSLEMARAEEEFGIRAAEAYSRDPDLVDPEPLEVDRKGLDAEILTLKGELARLDAIYREGKTELESLTGECRGYEMLDGAHHFIRKDAVPAPELIGYLHFQRELAAAVRGTMKQKERFGTAKDLFFRNVDEINIPRYFIEAARGKVRIAESVNEAVFVQRSLEEYDTTVTGWIEMVQVQVEGLLEVETKIVDQALGMAVNYRDNLMMIPRLSKIEIDGRLREMLQINFEDCKYRDEVCRGEMHRYIQDLTARIQAGTLTREELEKALAPGQLVGRVIDMDRIRVKIRKIDIGTYPFQLWEKIKASEGQENTMHIILLVVLISAIRAIVTGRPDQNTAKVLIVDNPFGSTGSYYLWEKIWSILDHNNVQMICSGHKIDAKVREFFPISYLLTDEVSAGGRMRINTRFIGAGRDLDRQERQKRGEILAWVEE